MMALLPGRGPDLLCGQQAHPLPGNKGWKGRGLWVLLRTPWPRKSCLDWGHH